MNWQNARESASILAERLKRLERTASQPSVATAASPAAIYVKPSRKPLPSAKNVAQAITDELANDDLIEAAAPAALALVPDSVPTEPEKAASAIDEIEAELQTEAAAETAVTAATAANDAEGRRAPRKNRTLPAYITAEGMSNAIPARVIDMSATGAKVELTPMGRATGVPMSDLPDRFVLVLRLDKMEVDCETVWREDWLLGVRFLGFPRPQQASRR